MDYATVLLVAQTTIVFFLAAWLTTGAFENVFQPKLNSVFTTEVMDMTRMRDEYPEAYADVAYRRVSNPTIQKWIFRFIVVWEVAATLALWLGVYMMATAIFGSTDPLEAKAYAMIGVLLFTCTWSGFLVAGNWFCYWFCHFEGQFTHFLMALWGVLTLVFLAVG